MIFKSVCHENIVIFSHELREVLSQFRLTVSTSERLSSDSHDIGNTNSRVLGAHGNTLGLANYMITNTEPCYHKINLRPFVDKCAWCVLIN